MCPAVESRRHGLGPALGARAKEQQQIWALSSPRDQSHVDPRSVIFSPVATVGGEVKRILKASEVLLWEEVESVVAVLDSGKFEISHTSDTNYPGMHVVILSASHARDRPLGTPSIKAARLNKQVASGASLCGSLLKRRTRSETCSGIATKGSGMGEKTGQTAGDRRPSPPALLSWASTMVNAAAH